MKNHAKSRVQQAALASVALAAVVPGPMIPRANAQALQPVVDVCSGITLPRSALTEVIGAVNQPIVDQLETTVNGLSTVVLILNPLLSVPDLDLDLSSILDDAEDGDPISLQILDTEGNVLTSSDDCNVGADGFVLNEENGVAIGGNAISGLGTNGQAASAAEEDAIAFGNNASTTAGAVGAVAIGTGASATAANSVALGAGSLADRGPLTGYTAPGLTGTFDSAGSVSVGAAGALRQITNVAPGTQASDAATVGQVQGALDAVAEMDALDVQYDTSSLARITLGGANGTTIANVAPGALTAISADAVNGSQLFATNQRVGANETAISILQVDIAALQSGGSNNPGNGGTPVTDVVQYDDASRTSVTFDGAGGTTLNNVAAGAVDATSAEAVNGSQLFATNQQVGTNTTAITNIDARVAVTEGDISVLQDQVANAPVRYVSDGDGTTPSTVPTNTVALASASGGAATLTNVAPAELSATSTDAVNGSQLYATNQVVAQNTADITTINNNLAGSTVVAVQYSNPGAPTQSNGGTITNDVTLIGANANAPVALHNVANGTLANDAVNLGQMQAGLASTLADSRAYTDTRFTELAFNLENMGSDMRRLRRDAFSGTASAMAFAGIPQTLDPGKSMIGGGIGHFRGQTAFAIGASTALNDGKAVVKAGATMDTHGKGGFSAGAGFSF